MRRIVFLMMFLLFLESTSAAKADELSELKQQVQMLQQRIERLEAKQKQQNEQIKTQISKEVQKKQIEALPDNLKWVENVKVTGDLRYRHETIEAENDNKRDRHRNRIRARLGIEGKVNEDLDLKFRIASGSSDPSSTNQTLDEGFSSKDIWIDRAYFDWHPAKYNGVNIYGGKMENPFYNVGKAQLIWDSDLNPEGIAAKYVVPLSENDILNLAGGSFWAEESSSGIDQSLWGAQAYLKHSFENKKYILAGASYYDYGNMDGQQTLYSQDPDDDAFGNTYITKTVGTENKTFYVSDYDLIEAFAEYGFNLGQTPVAVFGDWVKNTVATTSEDTGWLIGCKIDKAKNPGEWEFGYNYRDLEADAVIGIFTNSDFIGGGTDGKGHSFSAGYKIAKNLKAALTYFLNQRGRNDDDYRRLQLDLKYQF